MFANAIAYEQFMGRWSRVLAPLFVDFAGIADGWRVLDVGSGTGTLASELAARRPQCRIVGIEPSEAFVAYAKTRVADTTVHFEVASAEALPFSDAEFDACLSLLVFNFIPDPRRALAALRRVTRPGGRICAATWDYGGGMQMLRIFWEAALALDASAQKADEKYMRLCRSGELAELWKEAGLSGVDERPLEFAMKFSSFDDFWQPFLLGQGPAGSYLLQLAPDRRMALQDEVKGRVPNGAQQGGFELGARAWAVRGAVPDG